MFEHIIRSIGDSVGVWMYVIAAAFCFAEAAFLLGIVFPGETALLVAGVLTQQRGHKIDLVPMIIIAVVAAVAGDSVGFEFGKKFGPSLRGSRLGRWIGERRWASVDGFIHRHGGKAVLFGRLTAVFRALVPSMAGMSGMRYRTFIVWNVAGALTWAPGVVLLGYAFSKSLNVVGQTLTWAPFVVIGLVVIAYVLLHVRRRRIEREEASAFAQADARPDEQAPLP